MFMILLVPTTFLGFIFFVLSFPEPILFLNSACSSTVRTFIPQTNTDNEPCIYDASFTFSPEGGDRYKVFITASFGDNAACKPPADTSSSLNDVQIIAIVIVSVVVITLVVVGIVVWQKNKKRFTQEHFDKEFEKENTATQNTRSAVAPSQSYPSSR